MIVRGSSHDGKQLWHVQVGWRPHCLRCNFRQPFSPKDWMPVATDTVESHYNKNQQYKTQATISDLANQGSRDITPISIEVPLPCISCKLMWYFVSHLMVVEVIWMWWLFGHGDGGTHLVHPYVGIVNHDNTGMVFKGLLDHFLNVCQRSIWNYQSSLVDL